MHTHTQHLSVHIDWFFWSRNATEQDSWLNTEATQMPPDRAHLPQSLHRASGPCPPSWTWSSFFLHSQGAVSVVWPHLEFRTFRCFWVIVRCRLPQLNFPSTSLEWVLWAVGRARWVTSRVGLDQTAQVELQLCYLVRLSKAWMSCSLEMLDTKPVIYWALALWQPLV